MILYPLEMGENEVKMQGVAWRTHFESVDEVRHWEVVVERRHLIGSEGNNIDDWVLDIPWVAERRRAMDVGGMSNLLPRLVLWQMWEALLEHSEDPLREDEEERRLCHYARRYKHPFGTLGTLTCRHCSMLAVIA